MNLEQKRAAARVIGDKNRELYAAGTWSRHDRGIWLRLPGAEMTASGLANRVGWARTYMAARTSAGP